MPRRLVAAIFFPLRLTSTLIPAAAQMSGGASTLGKYFERPPKERSDLIEYLKSI